MREGDDRADAEVLVDGAAGREVPDLALAVCSMQRLTASVDGAAQFIDEKYRRKSPHHPRLEHRRDSVADVSLGVDAVHRRVAGRTSSLNWPPPLKIQRKPALSPNENCSRQREMDADAGAHEAIDGVGDVQGGAVAGGGALERERVLAAGQRAAEVVAGAERHAVADAAAELVDRRCRTWRRREARSAAGWTRSRNACSMWPSMPRFLSGPSVNGPIGYQIEVGRPTPGPAASEYGRRPGAAGVLVVGEAAVDEAQADLSSKVGGTTSGLPPRRRPLRPPCFFFFFFFFFLGAGAFSLAAALGRRDRLGLRLARTRAPARLAPPSPPAASGVFSSSSGDSATTFCGFLAPDGVLPAFDPAAQLLPEVAPDLGHDLARVRAREVRLAQQRAVLAVVHGDLRALLADLAGHDRGQRQLLGDLLRTPRRCPAARRCSPGRFPSRAISRDRSRAPSGSA